MTTVLALLVLVAVGLALAQLVVLVRDGRIPPRWLGVGALLSGLLLNIMNLTDWPSEELDSFWADHSVISATLSTLLLVGAGFLAFEARDTFEQQQLNDSISAAAFGGLVDHMVDLDLALSMLPAATPPEAYSSETRPLRWLRLLKPELLLNPAADPRLDEETAWQPTTSPDWRHSLVDQAVRRVMAAMRDWSPLLTQTRQGQAVLVRLGRLRSDLLDLAGVLDQPEAVERALALRTECTFLALGFELASGIPVGRTRPELLTTAPTSLHHLTLRLERLIALAEEHDDRRLRAELT